LYKTDKEWEDGALWQVVMQCGKIISFVALSPVVDNIWEVGMIRTRADCRGKGYARSVLADASAVLLDRDRRILYQARENNVASVRTALSVGYREVFRRIGYEGMLKAEGKA